MKRKLVFFAATDFPLLMILRLLLMLSNVGLSEGSSVQHCFMRLMLNGDSANDRW